MGSGNFYSLVFGVRDLDNALPWNAQEGDYPDWFTAVAALYDSPVNGIKWNAGCETEPRFVGIVLGVTNASLASWWSVPHLPERFAMKLDDAMKAHLDAVNEQLSRAKEAWKKLQETCKQHGHELPDADILLVQDWD